jgi:hypothetical protein
MFCMNCGVELPDNASFCLKCGKPQQTTDVVQPCAETQGHWEIKEFSEPILGNIKYTFDFLTIRDPVDAAVRLLLQRLTPFGWQPMEPIDFNRLLTSNRIIMKTYKRLISDNRYEPIEVRINFRRWVT